MGPPEPPRGLLCPGCGTGLVPLGDGPPETPRLGCPRCGETFRARRRESTSEAPAAEPPIAGSFALFWRGAALRWIERGYYTGVALGSTALFACGGFVPVIRGWLRDEVTGWAGLVEALGGAWVVTETRDPDADIGPMLARVDAPQLFAAVEDVAKRLGVKPPGQVRLTYLPCCGVVAWEGSRALILGLPLLRVLTLSGTSRARPGATRKRPTWPRATPPAPRVRRGSWPDLARRSNTQATASGDRSVGWPGRATAGPRV